MLLSKFYTNILMANATNKYEILGLLLVMALILSIGNIVVADDRPIIVGDLMAELEGLIHNECATISKAPRDGYFMVAMGTGCETIYLPVKLKADQVSEYVKSCLEEYAFVTVTRAEDDCYFHVFDPGNYGGGGLYGGLYGDMYGGMQGSMYGSMYGGIYGYGMDPLSGLGGLFGLYGSMPGITKDLYNGITGYGNLSYLNNGSAYNLLSPFSRGFPIFAGYSDFMPGNFLTTLLLGNIPLNNRPTAIPSEINPVRGGELFRRAHGSINPVFPGSILTPGLSLLNLIPDYPMPPFQTAPGRFY